MSDQYLLPDLLLAQPWNEAIEFTVTLLKQLHTVTVYILYGNVLHVHFREAS